MQNCNLFTAGLWAGSQRSVACQSLKNGKHKRSGISGCCRKFIHNTGNWTYCTNLSILCMKFVNVSWKNLGSVGRNIPLRTDEWSWKYMQKSQTFDLVIARLRWSISQAMTPGEKGEKETLKWKQKHTVYIFVFQEKRFDLNVKAERW